MTLAIILASIFAYVTLATVYHTLVRKYLPSDYVDEAYIIMSILWPLTIWVSYAVILTRMLRGKPKEKEE